MAKFVIMYNYGYGDEAEVIEADSLEDAENLAYEAWKDGAESQAQYNAEPWTQELEDDYC